MSPLAKSMILVLIASVIGSVGAVFLKMGAGRIDKSLASFLNSKLVTGVALYLASSAFYGWGIKGGQLSVLYPLISLGSVWTLIWSKLFFNEAFTSQKLVGLGLILVGVVFVGLGS